MNHHSRPIRLSGVTIALLGSLGALLMSACAILVAIQFRPADATMMSESLRGNLAIGLCVLSAALGVVAINHSWASTGTVAIGVSGVWSFTAMWLGRRFNRQEWRRLHKPLSEILVDAKHGRLTKDSPLVRVVGHGGTILMLTGIVCLIRQIASF